MVRMKSGSGEHTCMGGMCCSAKAEDEEEEEVPHFASVQLFLIVDGEFCSVEWKNDLEF